MTSHRSGETDATTIAEPRRRHRAWAYQDRCAGAVGAGGEGQPVVPDPGVVGASGSSCGRTLPLPATPPRPPEHLGQCTRSCPACPRHANKRKRCSVVPRMHPTPSSLHDPITRYAGAELSRRRQPASLDSAAKPSESRLAPPTRAPSTSGCDIVAAMFFAFHSIRLKRTRGPGRRPRQSYLDWRAPSDCSAHLLGVRRRLDLALAPLLTSAPEVITIRAASTVQHPVQRGVDLGEAGRAMVAVLAGRRAPPPRTGSA